MHQASVGFHCPECTKQGAQKVYQGMASLRVAPVLTQIIIGLNVAVFLLGAALDGGGAVSGDRGQLNVDFGLTAKLWERADGLFVGPVPGSEAIGVGAGEWYRLISSGFLHYGLIHLAVNMYGLWILGQAVEQMGGRARLGAIYVTSLLAGSLGALILSPGGLTAGASGAIFGLMGAIFLAQRAQGIPFRNSPLLGVLLINLVITLGISSISVGGHLGGLVGGAIAGWAMFDLPRRPGIAKQLPWVLCGAVALACVVGSIVVASAYQPF
jgi:membrane associated rhomboid family serine protease